MDRSELHGFCKALGSSWLAAGPCFCFSAFSHLDSHMVTYCGLQRSAIHYFQRPGEPIECWYSPSHLIQTVPLQPIGVLAFYNYVTVNTCQAPDAQWSSSNGRVQINSKSDAASNMNSSLLSLLQHKNSRRERSHISINLSDPCASEWLGHQSVVDPHLLVYTTPSLYACPTEHDSCNRFRTDAQHMHYSQLVCLPAEPHVRATAAIGTGIQRTVQLSTQQLCSCQHCCGSHAIHINGELACTMCCTAWTVDS